MSDERNVSATGGSAAGTGQRAAGTGQRASGTLSASLGVLASGGFYLIVWGSGSAALARYFLGHPVAIVATTLFLVAVAVLVQKHASVSAQWARFRRIRDDDLLPPQASDSPGVVGGSVTTPGTPPANGWVGSKNCRR